MKAARRTDRECQCGRPLVLVSKGKLILCQGCACDAPFCACHPVGLVLEEDGLERLLRDLRGHS